MHRMIENFQYSLIIKEITLERYRLSNGAEVVPFRDVAKRTSARSIASLLFPSGLCWFSWLATGCSVIPLQLYLKPAALVKKFSPREFKRKQRNESLF